VTSYRATYRGVLVVLKGPSPGWVSHRSGSRINNLTMPDPALRSKRFHQKRNLCPCCHLL